MRPPSVAAWIVLEDLEFCIAEAFEVGIIYASQGTLGSLDRHRVRDIIAIDSREVFQPPQPKLVYKFISLLHVQQRSA